MKSPDINISYFPIPEIIISFSNLSLKFLSCDICSINNSLERLSSISIHNTIIPFSLLFDSKYDHVIPLLNKLLFVIFHFSKPDIFAALLQYIIEPLSYKGLNKYKDFKLKIEGKDKFLPAL